VTQAGWLLVFQHEGKVEVAKRDKHTSLQHHGTNYKAKKF